MASADMSLDMQPLNYEDEWKNFEEITSVNSQHYNKISQKVSKVVNKEREENLSDASIEQAIDTLFEASKSIENVQQDVVVKQADIEALKDTLEKTEKNAKLTAEAATEFSSTVDSKLSELSNLKKNLSEKGDLATVRKVELAGELKKWRQVLGLELISSSHGGVILVFTAVQREDPERRFICELGLDTNKQYLVKNCNPEVAELKMMVDILNKKNDLSGFVVKLRKKFAELT